MVQKRWHIFSKMFEHYYLGLGLATRSKISEQFLWLVLAQARLAICFIGAISRTNLPAQVKTETETDLFLVGVFSVYSSWCRPLSRGPLWPDPSFPQFLPIHCYHSPPLGDPCLPWLTCSLGPSQRPPGTKKTPSLCFYLIKNSMIM